MFHQCPRCWYYKYIRKIPIVQDLSYAHAGSVLHKVLEEYYNGNIKTIEEAKILFNTEWIKYKLDGAKWLTKEVSFIKNEKKRAEYWAMVLNGIHANVNITDTEMRLDFPDALGYLDLVNTKEGFIFDWKSSTRSKENESEYLMQLKFYSYLYYRKFNFMPTKAGVYYLKYNNTKQLLEFTPTEDDIVEAENWHLSIQKEMEIIMQNGKEPPMCNDCFFFCPYKDFCEQQNNSLSYNLQINGNVLQLFGPMSVRLDKGLTKKFSYELKDSHWIKKKNPHANTIINFWDVRRRTLPLGFKEGLIKTLNDYAVHVNKKLIINETDNRKFYEKKTVMPEKFLSGIVLRDYQKEAVEKFLKSKICILQLATGAGKTEIAIECIRRLGIRTLFLVDKIELLNQTIERMKSTLGIPIGKIGQGVVDLKPVTVATIQTITKHKKLYSNYLRSVRFVIFDECHKVAAKSYYQLSYELTRSEYRLGLCLHFSTRVLDNKGGAINIKNIKTGDKVLSFNHKTNQVEEDIVVNTFEKKVKEVYKISVKKKNGQIRVIKCSSNHKFFVNGKYIKAQDLVKGNKVKVFINPHSSLNNNAKKDNIRKKISDRLVGRKFSKEHRENMSKVRKGINPWNKGITKDEHPSLASHRKGISVEEEYGAEKGKELRIKNSQTHKGKKLSKESLFNLHKIRSKSVRYPWLTYNRNKKIKQETDINRNIICEECKQIIEGYKRVHCHYIDKNRKNNNIDNLMIVCARCHRKLDKHKRDELGRFSK